MSSLLVVCVLHAAVESPGKGYQQPTLRDNSRNLSSLLGTAFLGCFDPSFCDLSPRVNFNKQGVDW